MRPDGWAPARARCRSEASSASSTSRSASDGTSPARNASTVAGGTAPVNSSTTRPSRNALTAGIPRTRSAPRRPGSRRRPPWPASPRPPYCSTAARGRASSCRHGPHQAAQKSTTTGAVRERSMTSCLERRVCYIDHALTPCRRSAPAGSARSRRPAPRPSAGHRGRRPPPAVLRSPPRRDRRRSPRPAGADTRSGPLELGAARRRARDLGQPPQEGERRLRVRRGRDVVRRGRPQAGRDESAREQESCSTPTMPVGPSYVDRAARVFGA